MDFNCDEEYTAQTVDWRRDSASVPKSPPIK